jgi:rhamnulose-1-phosphate aldolase/alcohol dehydrogenase
MRLAPSEFRHVHDAWDDDAAAGLDALGRLVYRSRLLGSDRRITNTGGGNTSAKLAAIDPITGHEVEVLWVKGSGGDLRTAEREHFASLDLSRLAAQRERYERSDAKGLKTPLEDAMVERYRHAVFGANPRASSIDTPLHAFVPFRHVDHTHPDAIIAIAAASEGRRLTEAIFGDEVGWLAWQRPGFDLGLRLAELCRRRPDLRGVVMGQHGLMCWHDDDRACYLTSLELIERAARFLERHDQGAAAFGGARFAPLPERARRALLVAVLPQLRGLVSAERRFIATVQDDPPLLQFVNAADAPRLADLGTSCPDHFLRTKIKPLLVDWTPAPDDAAGLVRALAAGLERYRADYRAYYAAHADDASPPMRDPNPTVILVPGIGMITFGKNKSEARVTAEFYTAAVEVMRGAEAVGAYVALPRREAFDIEYWALEEAKLRRMPPEQEFERRVVVVVGAGSGIGRAVALRLARERAHVVCADLDAAAARDTAQALVGHLGVGIGVGGSGVSACGPAIGLGVDVTDPGSVRELFEGVVLAYGGIDSVIVTAGVFIPSGPDGRVDEAQWRRTLEINVLGSYLVADEARRVWDAQGLSASLVLTSSVNAVVAKAGSLAYDASKAAVQHLVRGLAVELAPLVRVNGLAPATVVEGSSMFARERVISSLRKYRLACDEHESTEVLRARLAAFYAERTLTKAPVGLEHQAEAAYLLASERLARTTGQILTVDGGLAEAFLR